MHAYYCEANYCNSRIKQLIHNYSLHLEQQVDLSSLRSLQAEQANLHRLISEVSDKLNTLSEQNTSLNSQVNAASELIKSGDCESTSPVTSPNVLDPAEAINEYIDRQRQMCNLVIRNVPESPKQGKSEQISDNTTKLF